MSPPCFNETCKRKSRAICHCCYKNLCLDHLKEHRDLTNSQLNCFVDEINTLADQLMVLNIETNDKSHKKLDKWRDDCYTMINHYYEKKHQELQERYMERVEKYGKEIDQIKEKINEIIVENEVTHEDIPTLKASINDIKHNIKQFEEKGILIDIQPLIINEDLIQIEKWPSNEIEILTFPPPFQTIDCSDEYWPVMASNNEYLLMKQYSNLCLFDKELTVIKQCPWTLYNITDMCWCSTLNSFILITSEDGVFLLDENLTSIEPIRTIYKKRWFSCTCSDTSLFLTTNKCGSDIFEFNLLSSFNSFKQWKPPESCDKEDFINSIAYNNDTLALTIESGSKKTLKIELRSSTTLHQLWSLPLDLIFNSGRVYHICLLKCNEWLVIDYETSRVFQINKDGKLKTMQNYVPTPCNAVSFGSNILAIRTTNCVHFYRV